jgi:hypothetical protein
MLHNQAKAKCRFDESEPMVPFSEPLFLLTPYLEATRGLAVTRTIRRHEPEFPRLAAERIVDCEVFLLTVSCQLSPFVVAALRVLIVAKQPKSNGVRVAASRVSFRH